jgi:hypothetical protein
MNSRLIGLGVTLMVVGALFTFFTLGFGIVCTWPLLLIGFILFIFGIVIPEEKTKIFQPELKESEKKRYCPNCGRQIPFDALVCPYCAKKFE